MKNKLYIDRVDAGKVLAQKLKEKEISDAVVIAIPRGGVVTAAKVAEELKLPIDIIIPRKIGAPYNPEVAIGAVTQDGTLLLNNNKYLMKLISHEEINEIAQTEINEIKRRMVNYRGNADYPDYSGKTAIIIDDGIATGFTTRAAIISIKKILKPKKTILTVPVAPAEVIETFSEVVDEIICPLIPESFYAVGQFYKNFDQVSDDEVINLLHKSRLKFKT